MASTDARPLPIKNTAYRAVFPIYDNTGSLVTGAAGLDSEVSKDQGTFADCTNEATEIATSSGIYYLDLTSTEMNADCTAVIVKTSTTNAKTTVLVFYPQENGDIKVDVQSYGGTAGTFASGRPEVNTTHIAGSAVSTSSAQIGVNVVSFASGQAPLQPTVAGRTLDVTATGEAGIDWANVGSPTTAVDLSGTTIKTTQKVDVDTIKTNPVANAGTVTFPTNATLASTTNITAGTVTTATNVTTNNDKTGYTLSNAGIDAVLDRTDGVETSFTLRQSLRLMLAALAGKLSGAATSTVTIRDVNDTKNRLVATVDADGNRSAVTKDVT